ncbi:MAG: hypothetical protein MUO60_05055 [Clostridiaceae bacterium]|nr:hypothetical protein [Clostridiaceae bacterium]
MLNINEKVDYVEEVEKMENFGVDTKDEYEFYNSSYSVNFFGAGIGREDWE